MGNVRDDILMLGKMIFYFTYIIVRGVNSNGLAV